MKYRSRPRVSLTVHVTPEDGHHLDETAYALGISRHKLLRTALDLGLPLATAQLRDETARRLAGRK